MSGAEDPIDFIGPPGPRHRWRRFGPRVPFFERSKPPHDWRWVVGGIGKSLIVLGMMMFAFVGYQLWGTGIQTAQSQNKLEDQFHDLLAATTTIAATTTTTSPDPGTTEPATSTPGTTTTTVPTAPAGPPIPSGDVVARLKIPRIGLDVYVVEGVGVTDLKKGPGHFRESPMPGQLGNAAIAGHRTTYGAPFFDLDQLEPGDLIELTTVAGTFTYSVTGTVIVDPSDYQDVIPTIDPTIATLALATCHPVYQTRDRLVTQAVLVPELSDQVMAPPSNTIPTDSSLPGEETSTTSTEPESGPATSTTGVDVAPTTTSVPDDSRSNPTDEDAFSAGWFSDSAAIPHALGWGLLLLLVGIGSYYAGKAAKRLYVCFLVGFVPFVIVMYFFFQNVNRLLPPSL